jgi:IMP dehydrogenase/GMP reductase
MEGHACFYIGWRNPDTKFGKSYVGGSPGHDEEVAEGNTLEVNYHNSKMFQLTIRQGKLHSINNSREEGIY